jgi:hypothetical protein
MRLARQLPVEADSHRSALRDGPGRVAHRDTGRRHAAASRALPPPSLLTQPRKSLVHNEGQVVLAQNGVAEILLV